ncbi:MAG: lysophospholipid acyltransferase family protein [Gammaproteobacteria bacterium]|nr:lysophospholipid acyltransferase family protein [Gammaproteobacteria bacterium]
MLTEVRDPKSASSSDTPEPAPAPPAWWARLVARLPLRALYGFASLIGWLTFRFFPYREQLVRDSLSRAFPGFSEPQLREVMRRYYLGYAEMLMEIIKSVRMPAAELRARVRIVNLEAPRALLSQGQSVLLVAAHQCNWEWMLLSLSIELGYPVDAAYKPLVNPWAEREMKKLRTRFGSRLVPAKELLPDILKRRDVVRAVAMVADQEPTTSEHKYWTRFLGRDTAFYMGPEEIARVTRFPVFFIAMRRTSRGHYEMEFRPLAAPGEVGPAGELTGRYARLVEDQIHAAPPDWPWSHKRWKLKRSLYQSRPSRPT